MRGRSILRNQERRAQLVGLDGRPLVSKQDTEIPFIRWLPNGMSVLHTMDRGAAVYAQAIQFIGKGGRYACLINDGKAQLVAGFPVKGGAKGEMTVVAEEVVRNGPEILQAVDRLVAASVDARPVTLQ